MDRDQAVATFQEVSGIQDLPLALQILESHNWDLETALETALAIGPDTAGLSTSPYNAPPAFSSPPPMRASPQPPPSALSERPRDIEILVEYMEETFPLTLEPSQTVQELKETLQAITGVEVRRQTLFGDLIQIPDDNKTLASLGVTSGVRFVMVEDDPGSRRTSMLQPHQNPFAMLAGAHGAAGGSRAHSSDDDSDQDYNPDRVDSDHDTDNHGYPSDDYNDHFDSEASDDDYYYDGYDDDYQLPPEYSNPAARGSQLDPLIHDDLHNTIEGAQAFAINFEWSYHDAVAEARRRARPLFVYIHNDNSIETNVFCTQVLCNEAIVEILRQNFVCWGWDVTLGSNFIRLREMTSTESGRVIPPGRIQCPFCGIVVASTEGVTVQARFGYEGQEVLYERLLNQLVELRPFLDDIRDHNQRMERERQERLQTQAEIDSAYQRSLEEDRRKAEAKRLEEEAARQRQLEEQMEEQRKLDEEKRQEEEEQRRIEQLEERVLDEPPADTTEPVCQVQFRFPEGGPERRRFLINTATIHDLVVFVGSKGYLDDEYVLVTSFPKRVLNDMNQSLTLADVKLSAREQIHVQER